MTGCGCGSSIDGTSGPFSKGRELVEFVYNAHGGTVRDQPIMRGALNISCQGCEADFILETYLGRCPQCGGVHAVAPVDPIPEKVQYAGADFSLPL